LKIAIAYSSILHISLVILGVVRQRKMGFWGSFVVILSHGLSSPMLFLLSNSNYERVGRRNLLIIKGTNLLVPQLSFFWFLFLRCNLSAPPTLNLIGELMLGFSLFHCFGSLGLLSLGIRVILGGCYNLYIYSSLLGVEKSHIISPLEGKEINLCFLCCFLLFFFFRVL
jgi:NADH:ubiquinone oxidoreductase subunit 4 (subunit M)